MGAYNQPTILPYQPSFLERMAPALLHTAAQFGMQKLGQDWQASQKKIDKEHENRKVMLKGLMDNTLRVAKSKQAAPSSGGLGQAVAPQEQAERPSGVPFGGQVYEPVPPQIKNIDGVNVLLSGGKATVIPEQAGFSLGVGQTRYDSAGNKIVSGPEKDKAGLTLGERKDLETHKARLKSGKPAKSLTKDDINKRLLSLEQAKLKIQTTKGLDPLTMFLIKDNPDAQAAYKAGDTSAAITEIDGQIAYYKGLRGSKGMALPSGLTEKDIKFNMTKYGKTRAEVIEAFKKRQ